MIPWIDVVCSGFAILSTIVATLRAGSRILYLSAHQAIGVMEGPMILPLSTSLGIPQLHETNQTSGNNSNTNYYYDNQTTRNSSTSYTALYELSENFKHCVRLSTMPSRYENVQLHVPVDIRKKRPDPVFEQQLYYTLGYSPYKPATVRSKSTIMTTEMPKEKEEEKTEEKESSTDSQLEQGLKRQNGARGTWRNAFWRRKPPKRIEETTLPKLSSHWDYEYAIEADYFYNTSSTNSITSSNNALMEDAGTTRYRQHRLAELTVFCPNVFENLRSIFGISQEGYLQSILASGPFVSFQSNSKGAARVGGIFFFTRDGAYMIKTIKQEEAQTLLRILPKYHRHMKRYGRSSLLTRFCGMYQVNIEQQQQQQEPGLASDVDGKVDDTFCLAPTHKVYTFVVMNAVFPAEANRFISERFDLKGSTVGREVSETELRTKGTLAVMKDLDLAREVELVRSNGGKEYGLRIGPSAKAALLSQLREDVKVLVDCQVMDVRYLFVCCAFPTLLIDTTCLLPLFLIQYSLLVGIVHVDCQHNRDLRQAVSTLEHQERILKKIHAERNKKLDSTTLYKITLPLRLLVAPPFYLARKVWFLGRLTVDSIFTSPLPYYGAGSCVVDGGKLSVFHGERRGERAIYYMGLIDFLQPWTRRKVVERYLKGLLGYDTKAISSVTPEEYATRFLAYLDDNIT
jgi:hypothetical protein